MGSTTSETIRLLKALEEVRRLATREGWRYHHVQAIIVAIDQYAEAATRQSRVQMEGYCPIDEYML
jgi:hypothetical protein